MAGIYLDPWVGDEWQHGSATKWKLTRANCLILTYPDKQTKDLYLCHELNLDLLVELGNRDLWPHLPCARRARIWSASGTKKTRTGHTAF